MSWRATVESTVLARRNARLVATLWLFNLALALAGALPGWMTLSSLMGSLPAADALGEAFHFGVLSDLSELQPGLVSGFGRAALAALALGLVVALATTGGTLEVLTSGDERSFAHRFGRGAGRFFLRFLRLGLITLVTAPIVTGLSAAPLLALSRQLRRESGSEWLAVSMWLLAVAVAGLVLLFVLLVQDAARVLLVRDDERRVRRVLRPALATVLRHPLKWLSVWSWNAVLLLVLLRGLPCALECGTARQAAGRARAAAAGLRAAPLRAARGAAGRRGRAGRGASPAAAGSASRGCAASGRAGAPGAAFRARARRRRARRPRLIPAEAGEIAAGGCQEASADLRVRNGLGRLLDGRGRLGRLGRLDGRRGLGLSSRVLHGPGDEAEHARRGASRHGPQPRQDVAAHAEQAALPADVRNHHAQDPAVEGHHPGAPRQLLADGRRPGGAEQRQCVLGLAPKEPGGQVGVARALHL
jgi:hypothetical protein